VRGWREDKERHSRGATHSSNLSWESGKGWPASSARLDRDDGESIRLGGTAGTGKLGSETEKKMQAQGRLAHTADRKGEFGSLTAKVNRQGCMAF